jgi:hypothetical protein
LIQTNKNKQKTKQGVYAGKFREVDQGQHHIAPYTDGAAVHVSFGSERKGVGRVDVRCVQEILFALFVLFLGVSVHVHLESDE